MAMSTGAATAVPIFSSYLWEPQTPSQRPFLLSRSPKDGIFDRFLIRANNGLSTRAAVFMARASVKDMEFELVPCCNKKFGHIRSE